MTTKTVINRRKWIFGRWIRWIIVKQIRVLQRREALMSMRQKKLALFVFCAAGSIYFLSLLYSALFGSSPFDISTLIVP